MKSKIELIKYLASTNIPLNFEIEKIVLKENHPQRENFYSYVDEIKNEELQKVLANEEYKRFGKQIDTLSWEDNAKISFAKSDLYKEVGKLRLQTLSNKNLMPPPPYDQHDFEKCELDSNNLIYLNQIREITKKSNKIYQILLSLPVPNSMYWCARYLFEFSELKIRLDPFLVFNKNNYSQMNYKMFVYGKPPKMNEYNSLKKITHLRWMSDNFDNSDNQFTDAVWIPKEDEIHIIIEEIPKINCNYFRGSRYFHTIYNRNNCKVEHFDGAIRIYSNEEIEKRITCHVKDIGKIGQRIKIFQVDSEVEIEKWSNVAASFFVWNLDATKYFSN